MLQKILRLGNHILIECRLKTLPIKKLARHDSYTDHLVCPDIIFKEHEVFVGWKRSGKSQVSRKEIEGDNNNIDPTGWDNSSSIDNNQILLKKRASTSHDASKMKPTQLEMARRAKTSYSNCRKNTSLPVTLSLPRQNTPSQKARLGARCFLSALSDPNLPRKSLDIALMNLMGKKKEKYVI